MNKTFATVLALALAFSFAAPVANVASAQVVSFNTNLTVGSRGADVTALQAFLQAKGFFPATQAVTAYFGPLTRSAVAAYQSAKGITPAAGYFGPITRAAVTADAAGTTPVSTVPGCVAGALFSATTGQPCTTTPVSTVPGCVAGAAYSSTTGQPCTSTTTPVLTGTEGVVDVLLAPTPSNNSNVQTNVDVPVFGIEFRGKIAPVAVQTLDLQVSVQSGSSMENPGTLINTIKLWDGSNVVATVPVSLATFVRDSNNNYYVRISGINNFVVAPETTKTLTVSFSTNYIDTSRTVSVSTYGSSAAIRTVSGNGISSFYGLTGASRTHIFQKPGLSTVTVSAAANPVRSQNSKLSTSVTTETTALTFNVKSENSSSKVTTVVATTSASGVSASNLVFNLYDGSTKIDSKTGSTSVTFSNLSVNVDKDQTKTLTVKVEFPATSTGSQVAGVSVTSVSFDNANGSSNTVSTTVNGANQYAYAQSANLTLASTPTLTATANPNATSTTLTASFRINTMPQGGDFVFSAASGTVSFLNSSGASIKDVPATISKNTVTNIPDGSSEVVEVSAVLSSTDSAVVSGANQYRARLAGLRWQVGSNTVTQTYGFEDYITNLVTVTK
ncbi:MAG TPA: peptidoglycan-binding domain-containing protein [Candidatus Paceibacterota bacterium]